MSTASPLPSVKNRAAVIPTKSAHAMTSAARECDRYQGNEAPGGRSRVHPICSPPSTSVPDPPLTAPGEKVPNRPLDRAEGHKCRQQECRAAVSDLAVSDLAGSARRTPREAERGEPTGPPMPSIPDRSHGLGRRTRLVSSNAGRTSSSAHRGLERPPLTI